MRKIYNKKILLCKISNLIFNKKISFSTDIDENLQVGLINYDINHVIQAHYHPKIKRVINNTSEVLILLRGSIQIVLYDENRKIFKKIKLKSPKIINLYGHGHKIKILTKKTNIIEIKQGPYVDKKDKILIK